MLIPHTHVNKLFNPRNDTVNPCRHQSIRESIYRYASRDKNVLSAVFIAVASVLTAGISMHAQALPSDAQQPIRLLADRATYSERTGVNSYSGNVTITQGTLKLAADNITVNLSNNRSIQSAVLSGRPATMQQVVTKEKGLARGQANKIDYNAVNGIVTLTGNAKLTQNGASFSGNVIRYSLKVGDVEATSGGSQRVELIFPPNAATSRKGIR